MPLTLFSGAALKAIVDQTLAKVPADKTLAIVTSVDDKSVNVAVAVRKGTAWTIGAAVTRAHDGTVQAGASATVVF